MSEFFKGLKIIELAGVLAGPSVGMFFAELGAEVLKVENKKTGGDVTRTWRLPGEAPDGVSAYYCAVNYGKRTIQADLSIPEERNALLEQIKTADVVLANYQPRTAQKLGMDYPTLRACHPTLIYAQLNGFCESSRPAFDVVLQAETGWISMTGTSKDQHAKLPVALIDVIAGHQMKEAVLLALIHRLRTGEGSYVACSLEQAALSALANQATNYLMEGHVAAPIGTLHPNIAPYGDWFTAACGRRMVLAVGSDAQFAALCETLGNAELSTHPHYATNAARVKHRPHLAKALATTIATKPLHHWAKLWDARNIPYGEIKPLDAVLQSPAARAMYLREVIDGKETCRLSGNAIEATFLSRPS
jgi:crotonobetainyl-CoA:carnitine CoA-transferase CaiB-like acyl-CoA transferase